jgi:hypothetical protein
MISSQVLFPSPSPPVTQSGPSWVIARNFPHLSAGVFHGSNEFIISRVLHRHDHDDDDDDLDDEYGYSQLNFALEWISQLGSQRSLLTSIVIDVGALCPGACHCQVKYFDILPLVPFI